MLSTYLEFDFVDQLDEYAFFITNDDEDIYVPIVFWVKTKDGFVGCVKVDTSDVMTVHDQNVWGMFRGYVEKDKLPPNAHIISK